MSENPADLSAIFNQQELEDYLEKYETFLQQERFIQAKAINCAWKELEKDIKTTTPDFELCKLRAPRSLQYAGKEFFEIFEDVINTKFIYDGSSERGIKHGTNCIAHLCYVEAKQAKQEKRAACWRVCGVHPEFSDWKDIDMEVRNLPGLGRIRRGISVVRKQQLLSFGSEGRSNKDAYERQSTAITQPNATSTQDHPIQKNQVICSGTGAATIILNAAR